MPLTPCAQGNTVAGNYTLGTMTLEVRQTAGYYSYARNVFGSFSQDPIPRGTGWSIGNIQVGGFTFTPSSLEHRRGTDNSLDGIFIMGKDYAVTFTADEIVGYNLAMVLSEGTVAWVNTLVPFDQTLYIPLRGAKLFNEYAVRLSHVMPDQTTKLVIEFWRAEITQEFSLEMTRDNFASFQGTIKSLYCEGRPEWPPEDPAPAGGTWGPYGRIYLTSVASGVSNKGQGEEGWFELTS